MPGFSILDDTMAGSSDIQWCFSQVKGTLDDDVTEGKTQSVTSTPETLKVTRDCCFAQTADIISCVEFNQDGDLLATGDKGGRVVIFQRDPAVSLSRIERC